MHLDGRAREALLDTLFENQFDELYEIDLATGVAIVFNTHGKNIPAPYEEEFAYEPKMRMYLDMVVGKEDPTGLKQRMSLETIRRQLEKEKVYRVYLLRKGGEDQLIIRELCFFRERTDPDKILMTGRDITGMFTEVSDYIRRLEETVSQAQDAVREGNAMLTLMGRRLRSPLYSIMGLSRIAQDEVDETGDYITSQKAAEYLQKISASGASMHETIDDILDLRRIAQREILLKEEPIDLEDLLLQTEGIFRGEEIPNTPLCLPGMLQTEGVRVMADRHCLQQIVIKLLRCASSCTLPEGSIQLIARTGKMEGESIRLDLSVQSSDLSISPDDLHRALTAASRLDALAADLPDALRIDMIILQGYARELGVQEIQVKAGCMEGPSAGVVGDGPEPGWVSVTLQLPTVAPDEEILPDFTGLRALVADDNQMNLEVEKKVLTARGFEVVCVSGGREAVERFSQEEEGFDIIFMDILMPVMDGLEAAKRIRAMETASGADRIPIVAMTATAFPEDVQRTYEAGMDLHLIKPVSPEQMYAAAAQLLGLGAAAK